jgi:hypothetical protein
MNLIITQSFIRTIQVITIGMPNYIEVLGSNFSKTSKYEFALAIFTILT